MSSYNLDNLRQQTNIYDPLVQRQLIEAIESGQYQLQEVISVITQIHETTRAKQYGMWQRLNLKKASRYEWDDPRLADGVPIYAKTIKDKYKVNHKSHTPFDRSIMNNKASFFMGKKIEITLQEDQEVIDNLYKRLGFETVKLELAQNATDQGSAYLLVYSPEGEDKAFISRKESYHCVVLYDQDTMKAKYGLIYAPNLGWGTNDQRSITSSEYQGVWYDTENQYEFTGALDSLTFSEPQLHLFSGVPLVEFANNTERISDVELTIGLQDLYDVMDSDLLSELSQLRLAYLLIKNMGIADQETLDALKQAGVFASDDEHAGAEFITKDLNHEAVEYAKRDLKARIYEQANSYDPNTISGSGDITAFQIRMKLKPLEDSTKETELSFRRSFVEVFRLIGEFNDIYNKNESYNWMDIDFVFNRNYPVNIVEDIKGAREAGLIISQDTLAELMPIEFDQELNKTRLLDEGMGIITDEDNDEKSFTD